VGRKGLIKGERSCLSTFSLFFDGRIQDERRARTRTRPTPMAEYQIEDTSYKSRWPLSRWVEGSCWSVLIKVNWSLSDQEAGHPAVEFGEGKAEKFARLLR